MMEKISQVLFGLSFGVFILLFVFHVVYHSAFLYDPDPVLAEHVSSVIAYIDGHMWNPFTLSLLSDREIIHMQDVADLFSLVRVFFVCSILFFAITSAYLLKKELFVATIFVSAKAWLVGIFVFCIISLLFFKSFFLFFHKLAFTNDYWLLPSNSVLIRLFPEHTFFTLFSVTLLSAVLVHLVLLGCIYAHSVYKRKEKPNA